MTAEYAKQVLGWKDPYSTFGEVEDSKATEEEKISPAYETVAFMIDTYSTTTQILEAIREFKKKKGETCQ